MRVPSIVLAVVLTACAVSADAPAFEFGPNTPGDLRALADETMDLAAAAMPLRLDCLDGVTVVGAWELDDRARYQPDRAEITVRIPATAPQLTTSLIHELGHHLEYACPGQLEIRRDFLIAQGFDVDTPWTEGESWETSPAEHWASAIVLHVLGRPDERAGIALRPAALDLIDTWAGSP